MTASPSLKVRAAPRGKSNHQTAGLRLQKRDLQLFAELGEVGLLDTGTLHERHFPDDKSGQACRRRLRLYAHHDLTQRVFLNVSSTRRTGRLPTLHRLTPHGAEVLADETGRRVTRLARSDPPKPHTLLHRLGMAKTVLAVNDACQLHRLAKPEWKLEYDAVSGAPLNAPFSQRFLLCHDFPTPDGTKRTCWPDAACRLSINQGGRQWHLAIFWEYDRSTEGTDVRQKMPGYELLFSTQAFRRHWRDAQAARIFFVCQTTERLHNVAATIHESPAAKFVRLATVHDLKPARLLIEPIWQTVGGEHRPILSS